MLRKALGTLAVLAWTTALVYGQLSDAIILPNHPAIGYPGTSSDAVAIQ